MDQSKFNQLLFSFLDDSPTPFHAVKQASRLLLEANFIELFEGDAWNLEVGKSYFVTRNGSSLCAFRHVNDQWPTKGGRFFGAHTDSPCLKLKPNAELRVQSYLKLGVEVYGGALLNPWFDRDLSLAGRIQYIDDNGDLRSVLIDFEKAVAFIPSLAIHLDREANKKRSINPQKDIPPVMLRLSEDDKVSLTDILIAQMNLEYPKIKVKEISDFELSFYDVQKAAYVGLNEDFICSARLDNLVSCYLGLQAIVEPCTENAVIVLNDHEEVGSQSAVGAQGPFLSNVIDRICGGSESSARCLSRSLLISSDNAHGIHPNYPDVHDSAHGPILNNGPVIKTNANQRYASNSFTSAIFRYLCDAEGVPVQSFVVRTDMACGSTIGPIAAAELGVQAVDVGVPSFAMHSIRESVGSDDAFSLYKVSKRFFNYEADK